MLMIAGILQAGTGSGIAEHSPVMVCRVLERGSRRGRPADGNALLLPLFAVGGVGLGMNYTALTGQMTGGVPLRLAAAIGGVSAILLSIGGSISVAAVGSLYLSLAHTGTAADRDPATAVRAFAVTTAALAGIGVLAILAAHQATQPRAAPASQEQALDLAETELTAP